MFVPLVKSLNMNLNFSRFARRALDRLLNDWEAVKSMLLTGHKSGTSSSAPLYEDRAFLVRSLLYLQWGSENQALKLHNYLNIRLNNGAAAW